MGDDFDYIVLDQFSNLKMLTLRSRNLLLGYLAACRTLPVRVRLVGVMTCVTFLDTLHHISFEESNISNVWDLLSL